MNPQKFKFTEVFHAKYFSDSIFVYHYLILGHPILSQCYQGLLAVQHKQRSSQIYSRIVQDNFCHHLIIMRNHLHID